MKCLTVISSQLSFSVTNLHHSLVFPATRIIPCYGSCHPPYTISLEYAGSLKKAAGYY